MNALHRLRHRMHAHSLHCASIVFVTSISVAPHYFRHLFFLIQLRLRALTPRSKMHASAAACMQLSRGHIPSIKCNLVMIKCGTM